YGTQDNGTWRLRSDGRLTKIEGGDGMLCQIDPNDSRYVYGSFPQGDIEPSDDGGGTLHETNPLEGGSGARGTPYVLGIDSPSNGYACYKVLWLGTNRGGRWTNLTKGALGPSTECSQIALAPSDPKTIYVAKQGELDSWHWRAEPDPRPPFLGG